MSKYDKAVPNFLTLLRILSAPLLLSLYLIYHKINFLMFIIFVLAAITDWLDGYLARKNNNFSAFGAFLDPVADKLLVTVSLIIIAHYHAENYYLLVFSIIIISREIAVSALREWMASIGKIKLMRVKQLAKFKTGAQMLGIGLLLADFSIFFNTLGFVSLMLATFFTLFSMCQYLKIAAQDLTFFSESR